MKKSTKRTSRKARRRPSGFQVKIRLSDRYDYELNKVLETGGAPNRPCRLTGLTFATDGDAEGTTVDIFLTGSFTGGPVTRIGTMRTGSVPITRNFRVPTRSAIQGITTSATETLNPSTVVYTPQTAAPDKYLQGYITFHFAMEPATVLTLGVERYEGVVNGTGGGSGFGPFYVSVNPPAEPGQYTIEDVTGVSHICSVQSNGRFNVLSPVPLDSAALGLLFPNDTEIVGIPL
jgi:hypothetical protein